MLGTIKKLILLTIISIGCTRLNTEETSIEYQYCDQELLKETLQKCRKISQKDTLKFYTELKLQQNSKIVLQILDATLNDSLVLVDCSSNFNYFNLKYNSTNWILQIEPKKDFLGLLYAKALIYKSSTEAHAVELHDFVFSYHPQLIQ